MLSGLVAWVQEVVGAFGPVGVAALVVLENLFPPIPSEVILPFAGFSASGDVGEFLLMLLAATVGSTIGSLILYYVAVLLGRDRLERLVGRFGRFFGVSLADFHKSERWFTSRAKAAVLLGRCVPIVRSLVSLPAGFCRMNLVSFTVLSFLGSLVWNAALIGAGSLLGANWEKVEPVISAYQYVVLALFASLVLFFLIRHRTQRVKGSE
jgi:membrane protein DedA with SNARE-associated domain